MKRILLFTACLSLFTVLSPHSQAADAHHGFGGDECINTFYVDDDGGSVNNDANNLSYFLNLNDVNQSSIGTLLLYSNDGQNPLVDNGYSDDDFTNGSGIQIYDLSTLPGTTLPGEVGLANDSPVTPVSFTGSQTGLDVEQVSYTSDTTGDQFVILEYRVINNTSEALPVRVALANDFDVDLKSTDARVGFDNSTGMPQVFQQDAPPLDPDYTTVGMGLIRGQLDQYRLESCSGVFGSCQILDGSDAIRAGFFNGATHQVGDLTDGIPNQDFASTIGANLGTLQPGEAASVVFCYNALQGTSASDGLSNLNQSLVNCEDFYQDQIDICGNGLINYSDICDDGNNSVNDRCPSGPSGTCDEAICGDGFLWNTDTGTETCDDGNSSINDACPSGPSGTCQIATCQDGFLWNTNGGTETCDDGNSNQHDACCGCQIARCGDGFLWNQQGGSETCDDGNNDLTDACPSGPSGTCRPASCGDGFIRQGVEVCDDGNSSITDACPSGPSGTCQLATCGDGFVRQGVEVCDTAISGINCVNNCTSFDSCSNGTIEPGEQCDDGNNNTSDACPSGAAGTCQNARCGDGYLRVGVEACDDGNNGNGDGCNSSCQIETLVTTTSPTPQVCGNGIKEGSEECDDGNSNDGDFCNTRCVIPPIIQGSGSSNVNPTAGGCSLNAAAAR